MNPSVELKKMEEYVMENSSFKLYTNGEKAELHFVPNTPEAEGHFPDGMPVEHIMYGDLNDGLIIFNKFITVSNFGQTETKILDDDPIMEWLKYI